MAITSGHGARTRSATAVSCSSAASSTRTRSAKASKAASRECHASGPNARSACIFRPAMTDARTGAASIVERIRPVEGEPQRVTAHAGGILASAADDGRVLTAGDDGKVMATSADGETRNVVSDPKHRWIDRLAVGPDGAVAWATGKTVSVQTGKGEKRIELPSSAGGLAFAPRGLRVAATHYQGVTLWFPNADAAPDRYAWNGSHLDVTFSPDGKFVVTAMQEAALHGWRLNDRKDMRMSGYPAKVRSMGWTAGGRWLAT